MENKNRILEERVREIIIAEFKAINLTMQPWFYDKLVNAVISLPEFNAEKLERVREYSNTFKDQGSYDVKIMCREILSILNTDVKPFDVREWLEGKGFEPIRNNPSLYEHKSFSYVFHFYNHTADFKTGVLAILNFRSVKFEGIIPTSLYSWEQLLKTLGVEL